MPKKKIIKKHMPVKKISPTQTKAEREVVAEEKREKIRKGFQLLRGMKDILPSDQPAWQFLYKKAEELTGFYGFRRIETPILESSNLFKRSVGDVTDIVEKEMYTFNDPGGESVSLRPEATASVCRAYLEHGLINQPQPVKLCYWGPMFRHDRPQNGRYRQFHQWGAETIGEINPAVDAELILLAWLFFKEIGLKVNLQINSIGCPNCRPEYKKNLVAYYRRKKKHLCADCQRRLLKNPLRLLDCKEEGCQEAKAEAPQIIDWLCEECKNHFMKVLEYLDSMEIPYQLDNFLVRGLDYYTKTIFEFYPAAAAKEGEETTRQSALGGGGRYDGLLEILGGRPTPGGGFSLGIERIINEMRRQEVEPTVKKPPQIFLAQIGEQAKQKAFRLFEELRREKLPAGQMFGKDSLKAQLEIADKMGVKYVLILGQKEILEDTVLLRDMDGGVQETIGFDRAVAEVKKKLKS